jgi:ABC-type multidrug transport system ATPase subunit
MDEANRCDRVALMQRGRIIGLDTPAGIARSFDRPLYGVRVPNRYGGLLALRRFPHAHSVFPFGDVLHYTDVRHDVPSETVRSEVAAFLGEGASVEVLTPTVEDVFIARMQ